MLGFCDILHLCLHTHCIPPKRGAVYPRSTQLVTHMLQTVHRRPRKATSDPSTLESTEPTHPAPLPLRALLTRPVILSISAYGLLAILDMALRGLWPVFYSSAPEFGGLGLSPPTLGLIMGTYGLANGLFMGLFFARIAERVGVRRLLMVGMTAFVPMFGMFPVIHLMARRWGMVPGVWAAVVLQFVFAFGMDLAYGALSLYPKPYLSEFRI